MFYSRGDGGGGLLSLPVDSSLFLTNDNRRVINVLFPRYQTFTPSLFFRDLNERSFYVVNSKYSYVFTRCA